MTSPSPTQSVARRNWARFSTELIYPPAVRNNWYSVITTCLRTDG